MNLKPKSRLTKEENEIERELEKGNFRSLGERAKQRYSRLAKSDLRRRKAMRKDERINIRLSREQLLSLKARAEREGLPYQSIVASVIQKYLNGSLVEVASIASMKRILKAL